MGERTLQSHLGVVQSTYDVPENTNFKTPQALALEFFPTFE